MLLSLYPDMNCKQNFHLTKKVMKKNIFLGIVFMLMSLHQLAAQDSLQANLSVARRFAQSFKGAKHVSWISLPKKVSQAQFYFQGGSWLAYFDQEGKLITSGRRIKSLSDLPLKVQDGFRRAKARLERKSPAAFDLSIVFEMLKDETTKYFFTMQNSNTVATFSVNSDGLFIIEQKKPRKVEGAAPKDAIAQKN
jgi:hypothetical protein